MDARLKDPRFKQFFAHINQVMDAEIGASVNVIDALTKIEANQALMTNDILRELVRDNPEAAARIQQKAAALKIHYQTIERMRSALLARQARVME